MYFVVVDEYLKKDWSNVSSDKIFLTLEDTYDYVKKLIKEKPYLECIILNKNKEIIERIHNYEYWNDFFAKHSRVHYVLLSEANTNIILNTQKNRFISEDDNEYDYFTFESLKEAVYFCKKELEHSSDINYLISDKKFSNENKNLYCIFSHYPTVEEVERKRVLAEKEKKENCILNKIKKYLKKLIN